MKKLIIVMIGLCLIASVVFGVVSMGKTEAQPGVSDAADAGTDPVEAGWVMDEIGPLDEAEGTADSMTGAVPPAANANAEQAGRVDFEALHALHDPEEKVLSIGDKEENWGDYFYLLYTHAKQLENTFDALAMYYGMNLSWEDVAEEDGATYAEIIVEETEKLFRKVVAQEVLAEQNGIEIDDALQEVIESKKQEAVSSVLGEEGTTEAFYEFLAGVYLSPEMHERLVAQEVLYEECCNQLYGDKNSQDKVIKFLSEKGYLSAAHILFLYNDPETGEIRDEETLAANKTKLESLVKELRTYTDKQARAKAFLKKTADLSEDSGKAYYPDGYTFTPGTMVPQFEDAVNALAEYEISDVVETDYGYHVIMRLPLSADAIIGQESSTGEIMTAQKAVYENDLNTLADSLQVEWLPGCAAPDLTDYLR